MMHTKSLTPEKRVSWLLRACRSSMIVGIISMAVLVLAGCRTTGSDLSPGNSSRRLLASPSQKVTGGGLVSIFLSLSQPHGPDISFDLTAVGLEAGGQKISLLPAPLTISSKNIGGGQLLVTRESLPSGSYSSLSLELRNAAIAGKVLKPDTSDAMTLKMQLPSSLDLGEGESHSLFITWDVFSSIDVAGNISPVMDVSLQSIPFLTDLLFVACPDIDTVYVIRTDRNWIISSLGVEGGPTYLAADQDANRLYVLAPGKSAIKVVDLVTGQVIDNIFIPTDYAPDFMVLDPDRKFAYVLDERGKGLLSVALDTGAIVNRTTLSFKPRYAVYVDWQRKLAVSSADSHAVYLFDPASLMDTGLLSVGSSPDGLLAWNNFLFVAESGANSVGKYDLATNRQMESVTVGFDPRRLLMRDNKLYVANLGSRSISLMFSGQLNISREIFLKGKPLELLNTENRLWIYASDPERGGIHVIDSTSNLVSGFIDLFSPPVGLAVLE